MIAVANIVAPDIFLMANACNAAYVAGALLDLDVPFLVTFGNHQLPGHESIFGEPVGIVDYGPNLSILNFGLEWDADISKADALLFARSDVKCKIINAFEHNAPVEDFLDKHEVRLIHDGHGPGAKVVEIGSTPTLRVGKISRAFFRVVRFQGLNPVSYTYNGHEEDPIPFDREASPSLKVHYDPDNDGTHDRVTAHITNDWKEAFPNARLTFLLRQGRYRAEGAQVESNIVSDDGEYSVLAVRVDIDAESEQEVVVTPML